VRVTVHEKAIEGGLERRWEGTRENVYALKIELEGDGRQPYGERIEISCGGLFYRLEPQEDGIALSVVGVPVARLSLCPQSANTIVVKGLQDL
jgi:hypothetical protein